METTVNHTLLASLIALAMAVVRILEAAGHWGLKKMRGGEGTSDSRTIVELGPEATRMIRETHERVTDIHDVVIKTNEDGAPLVYGPRAEVRDLINTVKVHDEKTDAVFEQVIGSIKKN